MSGSTLVAIASEDNRGLDGEVSGHFGRCPFYTMVELDGARIIGVKSVANPHHGNHQPGVMPVFINSLGAKVIIAGGMGPRAIQMFDQFGIEVATGAVGNVGRVLTAYLDGQVKGIVPCKHDHEDSCGGHDA